MRSGENDRGDRCRGGEALRDEPWYERGIVRDRDRE